MSDREIAPGLMILHGNRPELLRQLVVHWFRAHPLAPLENEIMLVQSNGIAQWLKQALAAHDSGTPEGGLGIAAAFDLQLPSRFMWLAYRAVLGEAAVPEASPFDKSILLWRLMRLLPQLANEPGYAPLARFLATDTDLRKRYQLAGRVADLFDQYQVYRADWLDAWAAGEDVLRHADGRATPLDSESRWQALLWRALLGDSGGARGTGRAAVHQQFLDAADALSARPEMLPRRVTAFGLSSLPRQSLEVLRKIARFSQVILCVNNPCELYWANLVSGRDEARRRSGRHHSRPGTPQSIEPEALHLHAHPLLAAWGKQGRDYIALLDELDEPEQYRGHFEQVGERIDLFESPGQSTMLQQLQADILQSRPLPEARAEARQLDPADDRSIRFHLAHSAQREVEILHDQLLAAFDADPTLRPRDVIVMMPDIDAYAPHIAAVFGQIPLQDPRHIPFSIADLGSQREAPLSNALHFLLRLPELRLATSEILDLLEVPAIQQGFGIDVADLPRLQAWIRQSGIRWGLDDAHRDSITGNGQAQNTWLAGLRAMLLGYANGIDPAGREDLSWHDIEPFGEVAGLDAALIGPLERLIDHLARLLESFSTPATPAIWGERLSALLQDFFKPAAPEDSFLLQQMQGSLEQWLQHCEAAGAAEALPLEIVREHWLGQLESSALSRRFMDGRLTFATLMPMRAIPFRRVCLLGMNDGDYPRSRPPLDFDLMARDSRAGDRSRRDDDRYLFLEALLAAREHLHVSWVGRSANDNQERPASVLVGQLRDHLAAVWTLAGDEHTAPRHRLLDALTVEHRLQAFSPAYFGADAGLFSYAREWEFRQAGVDVTPDVVLPEAVLDAPISLDALIRFLKDPVRHFFRERLRVDFARQDLTSEDDEPFALDALESWQIQDELISARLDAIDLGQDDQAAATRTLDRIRRRGQLAIGTLGRLQADALSAPLDELFSRYREALAALGNSPSETIPLHCSFTTARQTVIVAGQVPRCHHSATLRHRVLAINRTLMDRKAPRRTAVLDAWVMHLACHLDGCATRTQLIGKDASLILPPLAPEAARAQFEALVAAFVEGLSRPLPFMPRTGFAWLEDDKAPLEAARKTYDGDGFASRPEPEDKPWLQRCYPDFATLARSGEFEQYCERLLGPVTALVSGGDA